MADIEVKDENKEDATEEVVEVSHPNSESEEVDNDDEAKEMTEEKAEDHSSSDEEIEDAEITEEKPEENQPESEAEYIEELKHNMNAEKAAKHSPLNKYWHKIKSWFGVKRNRYIAGSVGVLILVGIIAIPPVKFGLLNTLGIRGAVEVTVLDESTGLPLKDVKVSVGEKETLTAKDGTASVTGIRLGSQMMAVEKLAYATHSQNLTIKSGTNEVEDVSLEPVGIQFLFDVTSWLSDVAIAGAEVSYSENSVFSDEEGRAILTIPPSEEGELEVTIKADGYKTEAITIDATEEGVTTAQLVIDANHFYITKHTGKYNLIKIDVDGENIEKVLVGTGKESSNLQLLVMSESRSVFLVSTREGKRNEEGSILYGLFKIDTVTGESTKIDESESIRIYGTSRGKLIYLKVKAGVSAQNPERQRLISYDPIGGRGTDLATSNYFNDILVTAEAVFYAPSDYYKEEKTPYLFRSNPHTAEKTIVHADEVWTIYRTEYDELTFDAKQDWYKVPLTAGAKPNSLAGRPSNLESRLYENSPDDSMSLRVDTRDGKGYLIMYDKAANEEVTLHIQAGLKYPLRWADANHIIFRVNDGSEIADYIIDIRGGDPVKISSVSDVPSYDRWYYYY